MSQQQQRLMTKMREGTLSPVPQGMERAWVRCKECGCIYNYVYQPYSLSSPIITMPCGHNIGQRFGDVVEEVSAEVAAAYFRKIGEPGFAEAVLRDAETARDISLRRAGVRLDSMSGTLSKCTHCDETFVRETYSYEWKGFVRTLEYKSCPDCREKLQRNRSREETPDVTRHLGTGMIWPDEEDN